MNYSLVIVSLVELTVGVVCLLVAYLSWTHRNRPAGIPLVLLSVAAAGWAISASVASLVADPGITRWAQLATYAISGPAAVSWFYIVVEHTGRDWWKNRLVLVTVFVALGVEWMVLATDPFHHLYIAEASRIAPSGEFDPIPGPLLWVSAAWRSGLVIAGSSALLQAYRSRQGVIKLQSMAILVAGFLPFVTAILEIFDVVTVDGLDFSVIGIAASAGIILWALVYADFLDIVPVARETLLESMDDAVVAIDIDNRVVDLNRSAKVMFDVGGEAIGAPATAVIDEYHRLSPGNLTADFEPVEMTSETDGELRHYEVLVSPIVHPSGNTRTREAATGGRIGSLLVFRDVTLRRKRESELEAKNARLEVFTSVVSHDLRNPLNVAQGRLQLARETQDTEHFDAIARALDRMNTLIEDILLLTRKGQAISHSEPVILDEIVEICWENVVTGEATLVVNSDLTLSVDRSRFQELMENLLRNAVEHGGEAVEITVGDLTDGRGFYFADDGRGIPEAQRERIFERGYSRSDDGTGLGLAIVNEIALAHGWTVHVTESEAGGTRLEFTTAPSGP